MFDSILHPDAEDAINILKADHEKVKTLFEEFEDKDRRRPKKMIVEEALNELRMHAAIEEEVFYSTVRPRIEKKVMNEADEEHHVAKLLIAELSTMTGEEDHYDAKFIVLAENIRHHIREEEGEMFPKVRDKDFNLKALGKRLLSLKDEFKENGIPATAEEKLIGAIGATMIDSSAKNAKKGKAKQPGASSVRKPANTNARKATRATAALRSKPSTVKAKTKTKAKTKKARKA